MQQTEERRRGRKRKRPANAAKPWKPEEDEYIAEHWGCQGGMPAIARALDRSVISIQERGQKLKLGPYLDGGEKISFYQVVSTVTGMKESGAYGYLLEKWQKLGLQVHKTRVRGSLWRMIDMEEFWVWAENHQDVLDFSRFEENALGREPEWAKAKRRIDQMNRNMEHPKKQPWSQEEIELLKTMLNNGATYEQLMKAFRRSAGAIRRKIYDLYLPHPIEAKLTRWTERDMRKCAMMIENGFSMAVCAAKLGRSPEAVRGKIEWIKKKGLWAEYVGETIQTSSDRQDQSRTGPNV